MQVASFTGKLSTPQLKAVTALASGETVAAAAQAAGVHRATIYNWVRDHAAFSAALRHSKILAAEVIDDEIRELAKLALDTIRQILTCDKTPAATRLKAAQYVLHGVAHPANEQPVPKSGDVEHELNTIIEDISLDAAQNAAAQPNPPPASTPIRQNSTLHMAASAEPAVTALPPPAPTPIRQNSTPRNAPCPCRSGEKYKRCCGKAAPPVLYPAAA